LYKIIGWYKLTLNIKALLLVMNKIEIEAILDKTEILYTEVLGRFLAEDNLAENLL
jgi:hypothetical protein